MYPVGLLGIANLANGRNLESCNVIHTFFLMHFVWKNIWIPVKEAEFCYLLAAEPGGSSAGCGHLNPITASDWPTQSGTLSG